MAIIKLYPENVEYFAISAHPHKHFSSNSLGTVGSAYVYPRRSSIEKTLLPISAFLDSEFSDKDINSKLMSIKQKMYQTGTHDIYSSLDDYMSTVSQQTMEARKSRYHDIIRFTPTVEYTADTVRKLIVKDTLGSFYRTQYPTAQWGYTNYNCLSFYTASTFPPDAALLYPNIDQAVGGAPSGQYVMSEGFTFEFHINPRYKNDNQTIDFKPGTILHLSSCYAVSLISGSQRDELGRVAAYRILLQLSHSADVSPSEAIIGGGYPNDLSFVSDDNSLSFNTWHRVVLRWGTDQINWGTGSIMIDSGNGLVSRGTFVVPSGSVAPAEFLASGNPDVLVVGNYYEGANSGNDAQSLFFTNDVAERDGLVSLVTPGATTYYPDNAVFSHPLNADIHDVSIRPRYVFDSELTSSNGSGPTSLDGYSFYLSPFFLRESPLRKFVDLDGGVMQSPFFSVDGTTTDPFNVALSFGVAGHDINLENFVKDIANDLDPRCFYLTGGLISTSTDARSANSFLWDQPALVKRNMLIMPCDDGTFIPNFDLIVSRPDNPLGVSTTSDGILDDGLSMSKYTDSLGVQNLSWISLENMISTGSAIFNTDSTNIDTQGNDVRSNRWADDLVGPTPEATYRVPGLKLAAHNREIANKLAAGTFKPSDQDAASYTVYQRTKDASSNEVVFFDISNLYYGNRIYPTSLTIIDSPLSGSEGQQTITIKDDGYGNLYRVDSNSTPATWNSVGNVFYEEGIIAIKSPHLFQFGVNQFDIDFKGEQSIHVHTIDVVAPANMINSSSNPSYLPISASLYPNDNDTKFVYISGINFHDDNMNVVMKTQLAQPIVKRSGSRIAFRCKIDF